MPNWKHYDSGPFYDELIQPNGQPRPGAESIAAAFGDLDPETLMNRQAAAERAVLEMGITFTVYSEGQNIDRSWPFDIIPRVIPSAEWAQIDQGLQQRLQALNCFIDDIYHDQHILKDGVVPSDTIYSSPDYLQQCRHVSPRFGVWAHICGTDLVRDHNGTALVLEDNLRVPSGVSYMLENRAVTKRVFPELFANLDVATVDNYPGDLFDTLAELSPRPGDDPEVVVLTPGIYNSAYFEHAYLAQLMGAELVEGGDLLVDTDGYVKMRTIDGLAQVDTVYRRINDSFLDPKAFNPNSILGVPGIMQAWREGKVALANAPGAGVADDKVIYTYVPDIVRYYLKQEPLLPNVPTWRCGDPQSLKYVLEHLAELVVKPANESGGYGMLVGPHASSAEVNAFKDVIKSNPRNYIAQPTLALSTVPTICEGGIQPRHADLRPFVLQAGGARVTAGGLTRVALRKGSLVVNSSQGGGSKDTWIVGGVDGAAS